MKNTLKTFILLAGLTGLLLAFGSALGGRNGLMIALIFAGLMNFVGYWFSDKIALSMSGAKPVSESEAPDLYRMVRELCQRAELPMPRLYVIPSATPNAFATGRNPQHSAVAVTSGIVSILSRDELEGVVAHELAHIKNRDMLITTIAAGIAGMIGNLPWLLLFFGGSRDDGERHPFVTIGLAILAPIAAMLIQFAISRQREFEADRVGAEILGRPLPLAKALRRLDYMAQRIPMNVAPAAAPLAQVNPLAAMGGGMMKLFSTHPPTEERVARLEAMAGGR